MPMSNRGSTPQPHIPRGFEAIVEASKGGGVADKGNVEYNDHILDTKGVLIWVLNTLTKSNLVNSAAGA